MTNRNLVDLWCTILNCTCKYNDSNKWNIYKDGILILENVDFESFQFENKEL